METVGSQADVIAGVVLEDNHAGNTSCGETAVCNAIEKARQVARRSHSISRPHQTRSPSPREKVPVRSVLCFPPSSTWSGPTL